MKGKGVGKGSEKSPDTDARNSKPDSRVEMLHEAENESGEFNRGGAAKKGKKHMKVHGKKAAKRHDKRDRHGKFARGGHIGAPKEKAETHANHVKMRPGYGVEKADKADD
jgi:hypothetical protein